jgi:hypothetical protein
MEIYFMQRLHNAASAICKNAAMKNFDQRLNIHRSEFCQHDGRNDESKIIQDGRNGDSFCSKMAQGDSGIMRKCRHDNKNREFNLCNGLRKDAPII